MEINSSGSGTGEVDISLLDIYFFLKKSYKIILILALLGLSLAAIYLFLTPNQYEAMAQIQMAQIASANKPSDKEANLLGVNVEEPALLISRLGSPASFTQQESDACGLKGQQGAQILLAKSIKLSAIKNVSNVVELRVSGSTPQVASECARAVFEMIKSSQFQIVAPYIGEAKVKVADDQKRLAAAQQVIANADKSGQAMSASYLSTRDEVRFLLDEITILQNIITSSNARSAHLVSPIYTSDSPFAPRKRLVLVIGLLGGLISGILLALANQGLSKLKNELTRAL